MPPSRPRLSPGGRWELRRWHQLSQWLRHTAVLTSDRQVGCTRGQLAAATQERGRPRPINDMWIAAVSIANDIPLATRNLKDFLDFERHGLVCGPREPLVLQP